MKKLLITLLILIVLLISGCYSENRKCYDDCIFPELEIENNCSNDDNNCKSHYCYDLCYEGASVNRLTI